MIENSNPIESRIKERKRNVTLKQNRYKNKFFIIDRYKK